MTAPCATSAFGEACLNLSESSGGSRRSEGAAREEKFPSGMVGHLLVLGPSQPASPPACSGRHHAHLTRGRPKQAAPQAADCTAGAAACRPPPPNGGCGVEGGAEAGARAGVRGPSQASLSNVKAIKATSGVRSGRASGSGAAARTHLTGTLLHRGCAGHTGPCTVGWGPGRVHLELAQSWPCHPWGSMDSRPSQGRLRKQDAGTAGSRGPCGVSLGRSLHWGQGLCAHPLLLNPGCRGGGSSGETGVERGARCPSPKGHTVSEEELRGPHSPDV